MDDADHAAELEQMLLDKRIEAIRRSLHPSSIAPTIGRAPGQPAAPTKSDEGET